MHWIHGIALGALGGLGAVAKTAVHYALVWGGDVLLYRSLGIAPRPWQWKRQELVTDLVHKGMYALATGITFDSSTTR